MTLISRTGFIPKRLAVMQPARPTSVKDITLVVPVLNNARGVHRLLAALRNMHDKCELPAEILIVDNGSTDRYELFDPALPVRLLHCARRGPANARNLGAIAARTPWIAFMDSDCIPLRQTFAGYLTTRPGAVAYAGMVEPLARDAISLYYHHQEILVPPEVAYGSDNGRPDYLVTANCLVWREAFNQVRGFDGTISIAGGEDIDLGFRLRSVGQLDYAHGSVCLHDFDADLGDFMQRFERYGLGNRMVANRFGLDLSPVPFEPIVDSAINHHLAHLQYRAMLKGYLTGQPLPVHAFGNRHGGI